MNEKIKLTKFTKIFSPYKGLSKEIYIIALGRMINAMGSFIFPLLTLILTVKIGINKTDAGYIISASGMFYMFSGIIGGKLSDCFGRKKIIIIFNSLGALLYIVASALGTSIYLIPVVIFASFFIGIAVPASGGLVADITTPKNRDGAYSLFYMAMNVGYAISPIVGGLLLNDYLWLLFLLDGVTSLITAFLILIYIPESIHKVKEKLSEDRKLEKHVDGSIIKVLFERPILLFFALVMFGYNFVYSQWSYLYPIHASKIVPDNGASFYGTLVSFNAIIVIVMTPIVTKLIAGKKSIARIFLGGILYTIGFGMPGIIGSIPFAYVSVIILTLGEIVVTTSSGPFIANHTPASHRGRMEAVLPMIMGFGHTIGPAIVGNILKFTTVESAWILVGGVMAIFTFFTYLLHCYNERMENNKVNLGIKQNIN
ncbi:MFS transporter [Clostridium sp. SHJSY1]|uniref:MFS transporter n=1 Tax=Clostridium sp. SHJSY1 TaxID=2942483 RepID=UPI002875BC1F|nr:MFS transporter [Clostridium sp. SHJSY1]MDS0525268.1 MFS transporter [Clostridium sp. SHJSY1]